MPYGIPFARCGAVSCVECGGAVLCVARNDSAATILGQPEPPGPQRTTKHVM